MNSIGTHFYSLAPVEQVSRIIRFSEEIWRSNPDLSLAQFARIVRFALRSMDEAGSFPGYVRVRPTRVLIDGPGYCISSAPEGTFLAEKL